MNEHQTRPERATDITHMSAQRRRWIQSLKEETDSMSDCALKWANFWSQQDKLAANE